MKLVVIGAQWGDEGKGKIVDFLADKADVIVRFSGGANAGHTIVHEDITYKLHLVPSGIIAPDTKVILGSGMVIDPESLFGELDRLTEQGINWEGRVFISDRAHLVLPHYKEIDKEMDRTRSKPIGTTGRGIGVAYAKKASRDGMRLIDSLDPSQVELLPPEDRKFIARFAARYAPLLIDLAAFMRTAAPDEHHLLEGAQGALLDIDIGTYPYVSSGSSAAAGACIGSAIGPRSIDHVLGVFKAYSTRVGNGPFPSEFRGSDTDELEELVRETGREYGVTTGRPRRCGYLDLVALRYACAVNSVSSLALTHLDVYDSVEAPKLCIAYETDAGVIEDFPSDINILEQARPVTKTFSGWTRPIGECQSYEELPQEARTYIEFIEEFIETPISMISVGYERERTIVRQNPWTT